MSRSEPLTSIRLYIAPQERVYSPVPVHKEPQQVHG